MSEENQNNNNTATNIIIWLAGIMILVVGGVYLYDVGYKEKRELNKAKCESDIGAEIMRYNFGKYDPTYQRAMKRCLRTGRFQIITK